MASTLNGRRRPKDLPGLYWDDKRQRYFPISSRPKPTPIVPLEVKREPASKAIQNPRLFRSSSTYEDLKSLRMGCHGQSHSNLIQHNLRGRNIASYCCTREENVLSVNRERIMSFCISTIADTQHIVTGDMRGFIFCYERNIEKLSGPQDPETDEWCTWEHVHPYSLRGEVHNVVSSGSRFVAVASSHPCSMLIRDINLTTDVCTKITDRRIGDVQSANLLDSSLLLGGPKKTVRIQDLQYNDNLEEYHTGSDVLSVWQSTNHFLAGCRNGSVNLFDVRSKSSGNGKDILGSKFQKKQHSSVYALKMINEWQLLVATLSGDLELFDIRFSDKSTPILTFEGHQNKHTQRLGIDVDPQGDFVFAVGEDSRIRAWSTRTGQRLSPDPGVGYGAFDRPERFTDTPTTLQIIDEGGLEMWMNLGDELACLGLGEAATKRWS